MMNEEQKMENGTETIPELILVTDEKKNPSGELKNNGKLIAEMGSRTLTEAEQKAVDDTAAKIDLRNSSMILQYGVAAQQKVAEFSDSALTSVSTRDMGEIGDTLSSLVSQLHGIEDAGKRGGLFHRASTRVKRMKAKYSDVTANIETICGTLEAHQDRLTKDIAVLDRLYDVNLSNFKELSLYILAGKKALAAAREKDLVEFAERAKQSGLPEDAQAANDFAALCDRFEKRLYDLQLTRTVSWQMAPQIRMIQSNDLVMTQKIQSTLVNTIPLWKSQMVIALGLAHSQEAIAAERAVNDMTNELLRKNAEALKVGTVETAREAERGIVDLETLKHTNETLISTLDEVLAIQNEGKERRRAAEGELARIENEMRERLLKVTEQE